MQINTDINEAVSSALPEIKRIAQQLDWRNAEDVTQDVAVKLLKSKPSSYLLDHTPWLNTVVRNTVIDRARAQQRELKYCDRSVCLDLSGSVCEGLDEHKWYTPRPVEPPSMEDYMIPTVRQTLAKLPVPQRQALVLSCAGYSYSEISTMTGAAIGTVRSRIHYARKRLEEMLAPIVA